METPEKKDFEEQQDPEKLRNEQNSEKPDQGTTNSDEEQPLKESPGERLLRECREAPYLYDKVGQVFICSYYRPPKGKQSPDK